MDGRRSLERKEGKGGRSRGAKRGSGNLGCGAAFLKKSHNGTKWQRTSTETQPESKSILIHWTLFWKLHTHKIVGIAAGRGCLCDADSTNNEQGERGGELYSGGVVPVSALSKCCSCCQMMAPPPPLPRWVERVNQYNRLENGGSLHDISPMFIN